MLNLKYMTNHHPNCPHFNDSLMSVWMVSGEVGAFYTDNEADAFRDKIADEEGGVLRLSIVKQQMHREVFENLPEFEGF